MALVSGSMMQSAATIVWLAWDPLRKAALPLMSMLDSCDDRDNEDLLDLHELTRDMACVPAETADEASPLADQVALSMVWLRSSFVPRGVV